MRSADIARFFDTAGYWCGEERVHPGRVDRMHAVVADHLERAVAPLRVNDDGIPCRIDHLIERDPVFLETLRSPAIAEPLAAILGPTVEVVLHRHNHATRNFPQDIPMRLHRDIQQWSQPLVAVFIYLESSTVQNGCTRVVPGTHRAPYAGPQSGGGGGNWADEHDEYAAFIGQDLPVEMPRGGVLFLNCLCFHSVGGHTPGAVENTRSRYSIVFACRAIDELTADESADAVQLFGTRRWLANDALNVSGSLAKGSPT
ncbi:phytanoyl-CoA dioxygenase family protein [Mycolicibacterium peregrinum]|uniref:phytanoyl-CoA dioxygenase family protein n=1 Tax=Mycolicibacterium peregrinum TaxID=43304 RepID=UPI0009EDA739